VAERYRSLDELNRSLLEVAGGCGGGVDPRLARDGVASRTAIS
jgi:hypothetical protein